MLTRLVRLLPFALSLYTAGCGGSAVSGGNGGNGGNGSTGGGGGTVDMAHGPGCAGALYVGAQLACVVRAGDGQLVCWSGITGTPAAVPGVKSPVSMASDENQACVAYHDGSVWCWGIGLDPTPPKRVPGFANVVALTSGVCALATDGSVSCRDPNSGAVTPVTSLGANVVQVTGGAVCARHRDGSVTCAGSGGSVQTLVAGGAVDVQVGALIWDPYTCVLDDKATVSCGPGGGPLTAVAGADHVAQLSNGAAHCVRKSDGTLWCWGFNASGEVGTGAGTVAQTFDAPVEIKTAGRVAEVAAGERFVSGAGTPAGETCARLDDGSVWCWGYQDGSHLFASPTLIPISCN